MFRSLPVKSRNQTPRSRRAARLGPENLEARTVLSTYTMPLVNNSQLDPAKYSIYVDGFANQVKDMPYGVTLQPSSTPGVLKFMKETGTTSSYEIGTDPGEYSSIQFDSSQIIDGARIYFFVVPHGAAPPSYAFGHQPNNPPDSQFLYEYVELTQPSGGGLPTIDVSTVDGFNFPVTLTLNDGLGEVGQRLQGPSNVRPAIIAAYQKFMAARGQSSYQDLVLPASAKAAGQSEGLLNPYSYLAAPGQGTSLPANVTSKLNGVFDGALNTLFSRSGWSLMGSDSNIYKAKPGNYQYGTLTNPVTRKPLRLPGLEFTTGSGAGAQTLRTYNPVGVNTFLGANSRPITATTGLGPRIPVPIITNPLTGQHTITYVRLPDLSKLVLSNAPGPGVLKPGMYAFGTSFTQVNGLTSSYITGVRREGGKTVVKLNAAMPAQVADDQVVFSQLPYTATMQLTSGAMTFGGAGFFADATQQESAGVVFASGQKKVLSNLQNQIDSALNRGVAVVPGSGPSILPLKPSSDAYTTTYWGTESNWYPAGQPQNLFSLFLHTGTIDGKPIFTRPSSPASTNEGLPMGMAYGFAFDENPIQPAPANQAQVPSKFDPVPAGTATITITLGPWYAGS